VWVAGGCAPDGEGGACDSTPCGEGGASVCAPDGEGGAGGAPCGDWRGQRERRRTLWRAGGASVARAGAPDGEGGASVVGDSAETACCDNVPLARYFQHFTLFHAPPLTSDIMPGAVAVLWLRVIARICDN